MKKRTTSGTQKIFACLFGFFVLVTGCGGSNLSGNKNSSGDEAGEIPNASKLVTSADAQKVLGVGVRLDAEDNSGSQRACFYGGTNVAQGNPSSLALNVYNLRTDEMAKNAFENFTTQGTRMAATEPLAGFGDEGQLSTASPATMILIVRKKRTVFSLTAVGNAAQKPSLNELKSLARRIADEL